MESDKLSAGYFLQQPCGAASMLLLVSGCASFNSVHRDFDVDSGSGALVDIKQRSILVSKIPTVTTTTVNTPGTADSAPTSRVSESITTQVRVCAEPSPDALSVYAAELAATTKKAEIGFASQEGGAFVGLRTQSIQLLRDAAYRMCEAYLSGAISPGEYTEFARRQQRYMLVLIGVEQLTGAMRAPPVVIGTSSVVDVARSFSQLREELSKVNTQIQALETEKTAAQTKHDAKDATEAFKAEQKAIIARADGDLVLAKQNKEWLQKTMESGMGSTISGETKFQIGSDQGLNGLQMKDVAASVQTLIMTALQQDTTTSACFSYFLSGKSIPALNMYCTGVLNKGGPIGNMEFERSSASLTPMDSNP